MEHGYFSVVECMLSVSFFTRKTQTKLLQQTYCVRTAQSILGCFRAVVSGVKTNLQ
jgi:hypothetical protein